MLKIEKEEEFQNKYHEEIIKPKNTLRSKKKENKETGIILEAHVGRGLRLIAIEKINFQKDWVGIGLDCEDQN